MNKRNWKIIYSDYSGMEKKAVELVSKEMGALMLRDKGVYTIYVLACEKESEATIDKNVVVMGCYDESDIIKKYIAKEEIPENGYVVKVMDNPENPELKIALITAMEKREVFYGAADFVDDYFVEAVPYSGSLKISDEIFYHKVPDYYNASAPKIKTRSVFTWATPINDYRSYIENMARLKLNQLILWNDFAPVNAKDIVQYAHEYGISIIWGYAWGWSTKCDQIDLESLEVLSDEVIKKYEREYAELGGDGIYFQSFTELHSDYIGDKLIAEAVTDFVNKTAEKILKKYPSLFIQFGLHATSVEEHLKYIANVDGRVEILWEDCGAFPYDYEPKAPSGEDFEKALNFTDRILNLRKNAGVGMLYKGQLVLDWGKFEHQCGPYVLGCASEEIKKHDLDMLKPIWRHYQTDWYLNGKYAYDMTKHIINSGTDNVTLGMAGNFAGGIWFSEALCAQILWDCGKEYKEIAEKVSKRRCIEKV